MPSREEMKNFSDLIESIVREKRIDAIILHCEETGFELELAATLITPPIKAKISEEAQAANLIKKVNRLPI